MPRLLHDLCLACEVVLESKLKSTTDRQDLSDAGRQLCCPPALTQRREDRPLAYSEQSDRPADPTAHSNIRAAMYVALLHGRALLTVASNC